MRHTDGTPAANPDISATCISILMSCDELADLPFNHVQYSSNTVLYPLISFHV